MINYKLRRHSDIVRAELDNELRRIKDENPDEYYRLLALILHKREVEK